MAIQSHQPRARGEGYCENTKQQGFMGISEFIGENGV
jgi:hypothetical protein